MQKDELKRYLKTYVESITEKSKGGNYVCPICGSGKGKNKTGAFSVNGDNWKCFSCNNSGDIFDLIGRIENVTEYEKQFKIANERYGSGAEIAPIKREKAETIDYTAFFLQANKDIKKTDYYRGISLETLNRYKVGYVENWTHPKDGKHFSPRLIIPTSKYSYLARDTRADLTDEQKAYSKSKVGTIHIFNIKALENAQKPIFIVEGELDALSIIDVGGEATALGSTAKVKALAEYLETHQPKQPLIIALDNDTAGQKASEELIENLKRLNIPFYRLNPCGEYKDANEALQNNRQALAEEVKKAEHIQNLQEEAEEAEKEAYLKTATINYLQDFIDGIADSVNTPFIPTGFNNLDSVLDGGLYEGLYILGAISSLGKTTFVTQIADQIAQTGRDVLIFSLEMARSELIAKSISRITVQESIKSKNGTKYAKTARGITTGKRYENYTEEETDLIKNAIARYGEYANHIYISEGMGDIGTEQIRDKIRSHILFTGKAPVVIIDYLQILAPYNERYSDKQNTDKAVLELKRISRDYKIAVVGISSFNRENYKEAVNMKAFKESGTIEYSSDVLIGLQLSGAGGKDFDEIKAKRTGTEPREIELVVLKNRNGAVGDIISYKYYPMFNYFAEQ